MRLLRTFIFVDLSGFTNFTERNGDEAATELLAKFRAIARSVGSDHGVRIDKYLGDGLMAVAVEASVGIIFSVELQRHAANSCAPLDLRIGIATGETILFEGQDYIGSAPNLAARLCDAAAGLGALIPADQATDLPHGIVAHPLKPMNLPGFAVPIEAVSLSGELAVELRGDRADLLARPIR